MFEYKKCGETVLIKGSDFEYKRVGDVRSFKQLCKVPSLRALKTLIKSIESTDDRYIYDANKVNLMLDNFDFTLIVNGKKSELKVKELNVKTKTLTVIDEEASSPLVTKELRPKSMSILTNGKKIMSW